MTDDRERIARKIAQDLRDGEFVSFGHGIPYEVGKYLTPDKHICIQIESGIICLGPGTPAPPGEYELRDSTNRFVTDNVGGSFFDTVFSFQMIRGGHLDKSIMGAYQADCGGSFANWKLSGRPASGIGGAMDLAVGARQVILAMESRRKDGASKLVERYTYPLTAKEVVSRIYTEFGVLGIKDHTFILEELFEDYTVDRALERISAPTRVLESLRVICVNAL
ncbi:MAG: succinyl-CoA--3-ketoacid-CoA transferase [Clostridiales bacterium]|nr:succinyl-CoA--3-ketoacid-CoA transferase [Clostridiales bacterium]